MTTTPDGTADTVGVVGGMGPAATGHFFDLLVRRTSAEGDQGHLRVVVDSNPQIPDRTGYLLEDGSDPRPALVETARNVEAAGADLLAVPCNTAHAFFESLQATVDVPVLHMIGLAVRQTCSQIDPDRVGLLATDGTISLGLYHEWFQDRPVEVVVPDETDQERVMDSLYAVKSGERERPRSRLVETVEAFDDVDAVIAGCTEVPVALRGDDIDVPLVDPMTVMADRAIERAKRKSSRHGELTTRVDSSG